MEAKVEEAKKGEENDELTKRNKNNDILEVKSGDKGRTGRD